MLQLCPVHPGWQKWSSNECDLINLNVQGNYIQCDQNDQNFQSDQM